MNILNKKELFTGIIFCVFVFFISFFILNRFINKAMNENSTQQLIKANQQSLDSGKVKFENMVNDKIDIFIENILEYEAIKDNKVDDEKIIGLIKAFKRKNYIQTMGIIADDEEIFVNENNEIIKIDEKTKYAILSEDKSIFQCTVDNQDYIVIKSYLNDYDINIVYLYKDGFISKDLIVPVYTEYGRSYVVDSNGDCIFYSTKNSSKFRTSNILDSLSAYSKENINQVNKLKLDMLNNKSGIIKYENQEERRCMAYAPIGFEDLYLCTIIPQHVIDSSVEDIENLNLISIIVIIADIIVIFIFFKYMEENKRKKIDEMLNLDPITNGNSYKKFNEELRKIYNKETKVIYMSIDLDNFKVVNTVLGRECGDKVLKRIYEILKFHIGDNGCYCRKDADEFLVYYKYENNEDVEHVVDSICESIRHIILPQNHILIPSIGICYMNDENISIENLEVNAITAKKRAKNKINEFYSYFEDSNLYELIDNKSILDDMNKALMNNEFRLVYQPKFDAKTKKVVGAEALIRWTKSDNTTVYPNEFIPVAEKTGFITFIDNYVFKSVCENQSKWLNYGYNIVPISVNISREKLKDEAFIYEYLKIIGNYGLSKEYVELEITEGDTYSYGNVKSNIVDKIKEVGFKVLIDDFGVGYSSLTMLKDIGADVLKLDRSFVIDESSKGKSMLKHIIKIAKIFDYKVVAEGVETKEQYDFLKEDCDEIQGYYFSKPLEEKEFIDKYLNNL